MTYSKETLEATMNTLTVEKAMVMISQAGGKRRLDTLLSGLSRNFNATIPAKAQIAISEASKRWVAARGCTFVSYKVNC